MNRRSFLAVLAAMATGTLPNALGVLAAPIDASSTPGSKVIKGTGKEIYVSLARQRLWTYTNGEVLTTFLISSGEETRGTKTGDFRVQSKYPEAWSDVWQLRMPVLDGDLRCGPRRKWHPCHALAQEWAFGALVGWLPGIVWMRGGKHHRSRLAISVGDARHASVHSLVRIRIVQHEDAKARSL